MTSRRTRDRLIERLREKGISNVAVLEAMSEVPRHLFIDEALATRAYEDTALPIGHGQTISQPYIVARMTELLLEGGQPDRVLEVGTGSGYQAAVLTALGSEVYTTERIELLYRQAKRRLWELGYRQCHTRLANGEVGWPDKGPFDAIIVTAGADELPAQLVGQLAPEGVMVIPVDEGDGQVLYRISVTEAGIDRERIEQVKFVPLILQPA